MSRFRKMVVTLLAVGALSALGAMNPNSALCLHCKDTCDTSNEHCHVGYECQDGWCEQGEENEKCLGIIGIE